MAWPRYKRPIECPYTEREIDISQELIARVLREANHLPTDEEIDAQPCEIGRARDAR